MKKLKSIRKRLIKGSPIVGTWIQIDNYNVASILSNYNFDFICVDLEHGQFAPSNLNAIFNVIKDKGIVPMARVITGSIENIRLALDSGAHGIVIPMVEEKNLLAELIKFSRLPPYGSRGVGYCMQNDYGLNFSSYIANDNHPIIIAMIETQNGLDNIQEICKTEGLDGIFVGPYDLSASLGIVGEFKNNKFKEAANQIRLSAQKAKIASGIHLIEPNPVELKTAIKDGFQIIAYSMDSVLLQYNLREFKK